MREHPFRLDIMIVSVFALFIGGFVFAIQGSVFAGVVSIIATVILMCLAAHGINDE